jgi:hypothetical protein
VLRRAPDLQLHLDSSNTLAIRTQDGQVRCGPHGLGVLETFSHPRPLAEALRLLQSRLSGAQDWIDLMATIQQLWQAGVLQDERQSAPRLADDESGYDAARIHVRMLNDRARTAGFLRGIREVVRAGDVVVDVGTGTGVLAVAAARAGARHVYAIEASAIGKAAQAVFEANGLAERITLIPGWSTQVTLPERGDVLVTEMIGNEPLEERALEITTDAVKRLLKADARLVPSRLQVFGLPVTIPRAELRKHAFSVETVRDWQSWYGIDFSPLANVARGPRQRFWVDPYATRDWDTLAGPVLLADVDFKTTRGLAIDNTTTFTAGTSGLLDGLLVYFELELGPTTRLSTHPAQVQADNHWRSPVWVLANAWCLRSGDRFQVTYTHRPTTVTVSRAEDTAP